MYNNKKLKKLKLNEPAIFGENVAKQHDGDKRSAKNREVIRSVSAILIGQSYSLTGFGYFNDTLPPYAIITHFIFFRSV